MKSKWWEKLRSSSMSIGALTENRIDVDVFEKHDELDPRFWRGDSLKPHIARRLMRIARDFMGTVEIGTDTKMEDLRLTGSLANYNWSKYSDVDLHIVVDFSAIDENVELVKAFFDNIRMRWNDLHDIRVHGHEVEIYVEDVGEEHRSSGVYSLMREEWIVAPDPESVEIDFVTAQKKSDDIETQVNLIAQFVSQKPRVALRSIDRLKEKIRSMRKAGLDSPAQEFSAENIAFKILRRQETLDRLNDMKYDAYDDIMSMGVGEHGVS